MSIAFASYPFQLDKLKTDFNLLKNSEKLPCKFEPYYSPAQKLYYKENIATTTYGKELGGDLLPPYIEFSKYFNYSDSERKIILLHEIIHACQRKNDLFGVNDKTRNILHTFHSEITEKWKQAKQISANPDETPFEILEQKRAVISSIFEIPFELCDDVFFKTNYSHMFEQNMNINYNNISGYVDKFTSFSKIYQKYYYVYREMLRTKYLYTLNIGFPLEEKFKELFEKWNKLYLEYFTSDERSQLDLFIESLTNLDNCCNDVINETLTELSNYIWIHNETL